MDFDIGNILYIVITLVAVTVGLLGRKKKPKVTGSGSGEGESAPTFLENLEKAFNMNQDEQLVVDLQEHEEDLPEEEILPEPEQSPKVSSLMEEYERLASRRSGPNTDIFLSESDILTEPLEVIHLDEDEATDYFEVVKEFDAGTAVVYSAIINRVDY